MFQLQLTPLQKLKSSMNIIAGFCLFLRNIYFKERFQPTLNTHFWVKIMVYPIQMHPSRNDNNISKRTKEELNLRSYVHFEQVND